MTEESRVVLYDVNALVALALDAHVHHRAAHRHLAAQEEWATTTMTESGLFRLLLNPAVAGRAIRYAEIRAVVAGMRADPRWRFLVDKGSLADPVIDCSVLVGHQQVTDLHLVNLAALTWSRLATFDRRLPETLAPVDRRHVSLIPA